ncbi:hypothetical protein Tasa_033_006 [Tanticharoenia sakaeratensis NBRC 103193]|uniref:Uncharacterized protein n=1 Tax=Tanticharoenia sakaeratensis NBRC 103193 TaxID=1231623 RepID=A0A0D6MMJ4_9PROT|nr:hypothetical protein Tasa_033_006 [Tanticharoenia sakaeratensis NBRC 103193]GBQ23463.1 hypothetical protein AA103193_2424 [Tanticharoenia sakaeratensis NBRC 103193]
MSIRSEATLMISRLRARAESLSDQSKYGLPSLETDAAKLLERLLEDQAKPHPVTRAMWLSGSNWIDDNRDAITGECHPDAEAIYNAMETARVAESFSSSLVTVALQALQQNGVENNIV